MKKRILAMLLSALLVMNINACVSQNEYREYDNNTLPSILVTKAVIPIFHIRSMRMEPLPLKNTMETIPYLYCRTTSMESRLRR